MADFNKFQISEDLGKRFPPSSCSRDTLKVYLTNNAPSAADDAVKADLAGITEENGYRQPIFRTTIPKQVVQEH